MDFISLLDQTAGSAFLTAIGTLKGSGQITEIEGKKATDAIARMKRTQSEAGFLKALDDYQAVVSGARDRAINRGGGQSGGRPPMSPGRAALEAEARRRGLIK